MSEQQEHNGQNDEGTVEYYPNGPLIVAVGKPETDLNSYDSSVSTSGAWQGMHKGLVGFNSLEPIQSLQGLLKGKIYPAMDAETRITIAVAIVNDLIATNPTSKECGKLMDKVAKLSLEKNNKEGKNK